MATFLTDVLSRIRIHVNDPALDSQFTDTVLLRMVTDAWNEVYDDVCKIADWKQWVRHTLSITAHTTEYVLPPNISQILEVARMDDGGLRQVLWEFIPRHMLNPWGPGFTIENNILRLEPTWQRNETLRLTYRPTAQTPCHEGITTTSGWDTTNGTYVVLDSTPTQGEFDTRQNAYAGYVFRLLNANYAGGTFYQQERPIGSFDQTNNRATFVKALSPVPTTGTALTYEVLPQSADLFRKAIALKVARLCLNTNSDVKRAGAVNAEYQECVRTIRGQFGNMNMRTGKKFQKGVRKPRWGRVYY